jgi:hypothetical protein
LNVRRVLLFVLAFVLLLVGSFLLVGGALQAVTFGSDDRAVGQVQSLHSDGRALVIDPAGLDARAAAGSRTLHVIVSEPDGAPPLFVGVAAQSDASRYLSGASYGVVGHLRVRGGKATVAEVTGPLTPAVPTSESFWQQSAQGSTNENVDLSVSSQAVSIVVMKADAASNVTVSVQVDLSADDAFVLGIVFAVAGAILLALGILTLVLIRRRPRGEIVIAPLAGDVPPTLAPPANVVLTSAPESASAGAQAGAPAPEPPPEASPPEPPVVAPPQ